ncbi:DUF7537 family lipoprotein [Halomarina oriensis]|uniref:LppX_LprAFG lipoprotein n=1 Tax=Halomarina oriensis TaxID=671145 RepID=A0A6B0GP57_9EURY|nr:hypothetical protein [Halomarina oriensis]MWG35287.1 hypothetical protein [Halomarina oriensis]
MRNALPFVVVGIVCLAGCGGMLGPNDATTTPTTPAQIPTDSPLNTLPNGLSEERVDPLVITATHTEALENTSFTVVYGQSLTAENGTALVNATATTRVSANHSVAYSTSRYDAGTSVWFESSVRDVERWFTGSDYFFRGEGPDGPVYVSPPAAGTPEGIPSSTLQQYYTETELTNLSTDDGMLVLRLHGLSGQQYAGSVPITVTEGTVTVTMSADGRVEGYRVEYTGHLSNSPEQSVEGTRTAQFGAFGTTTVEPPEWLGDAREATANATD